MDYGLCRQTVTVYHREDRQITRQVVENCHYAWQDVRTVDREGTRLERKFLLVIPGDTQQVFPGDRVLAGIGPEVTAAQWPSFLPALVPGLSEAEYARPCFVRGRLCHIEAGRK